MHPQGTFLNSAACKVSLKLEVLPLLREDLCQAPLKLSNPIPFFFCALASLLLLVHGVTITNQKTRRIT